MTQYLILALLVVNVYSSRIKPSKYEIVQPKIERRLNQLTVTIESTKYDFGTVTIHLEEEIDDFIKDSQIFKGIDDDDYKAYGYLKNEKFFGEFSVDGKVFMLDDPKKIEINQEGTLLYSTDDIKVDNENHLDKILKSQKQVQNVKIAGPKSASQKSVRKKTFGNICRMRIVVDKFLLQLFDNDKDFMKSAIKMHEHHLNDIYRLNKVKVRSQQLEFKITDIIFNDEEFCSKNKNAGDLNLNS